MAKQINLLPYDGVVNYIPNVYSSLESDSFFTSLLNTIQWKNDEVFIFGKHHITKRKTAWYAEDGINYTYSNSTKIALNFTKELLDLKLIAEKIAQTSFNACLLNLYHNGNEGMGWHSDNEKSIVPNSTIASFSFGAERKFSLKHRLNKQSISIQLQSGSLLLMKENTQTHWLHSLPKSKKITEARINLTFRKMLL
jgi:alkylated DNA repair dioxygenase AlkB